MKATPINSKNDAIEALDDLKAERAGTIAMKASTRRHALLAALAAPIAAAAPVQAATKADEFDSLMDQYADVLFRSGIMIEVQGKTICWYEIATGRAAIYGIHNPEIMALHRRICALPDGRARLAKHLEQKPGPMTVKRAQQIAHQAMLDDGPLLADDVTGTMAFADWERARSTLMKGQGRL